MHPSLVHPSPMTSVSRNVHPTAIIDSRAKVPASCKIGPYCVVGAEVELGESCRLGSHVAIEGPTKIGSDNIFFPFCVVRILHPRLLSSGPILSRRRSRTP